MESKIANLLLQYRKDNTSQFGEDGIIEKIFEILPDLESWCVEFGAGDGISLSNTHTLINHKNWSSVQIESNPQLFNCLADRYKEHSNVYCLQKTIGFAGENTLDDVLSLTPIPINFSLLSIDVDGNDYHIWESLERYHPKVVIIEFNLTIPNHVEFVQPKDLAVNQGSSLLSIIKLANAKQYELIATTDTNGFFVDRTYFHLFGIENNSIWAIHQNIDYLTHLFQLYDGTLVIGGFDRLFWHGVKLDLKKIQQDIQVLPEDSRKFPGAIPVDSQLIPIYQTQGLYYLAELILPANEAVTWSSPETEHRFTTAESTISFMPLPTVKRIEICLSNFAPFELTVNFKIGQTIQQLVISGQAQSVLTDMEVNEWDGQIIITSPTWSPAKVYGTADQRTLGVAIHWLRFLED